jgi:septum formation topological specificity factor MinE
MFWAFMYWYFIGGGAAGIGGGALTPVAIEELSDRVEIVVTEPARSESAQSILQEMRREVVAFEEKFAASGKIVKHSYSDHAADRAEIESVLGTLNQDWERGQQRMLELRFELRDHLTREEWAALYVAE